MRYTVISWESMEGARGRERRYEGWNGVPRHVKKRRPNRKRRHKEEVQQEIIQDREKIWKTRQIFFKWLRIKKVPILSA